MASRDKLEETRRPAPRLYLVAPPHAAGLENMLAGSLGVVDIAAVLLRLPASDERGRTGYAKALAPTIQRNGTALLLDGSVELAARAGADGAHVAGLANLEVALATLKPERIAGCGALVTRDDAMRAAEAGADYVMFGDPDESGQRPPFDAVTERVTWWAELFEVPCVGYAMAPAEIAPLAAAGADFVAMGEWVFADPSRASAALTDAARALAGMETAA
ncbi:MAG: thiamine phosphate synthase [Xanthobacteraceae bacterium]